MTYIQGSKIQAGRTLRFKSTLRSEQRLEGQQIVQQRILAERTELTSGKNPPNLLFNLPTSVAAGQPYQLDAIVREPLGDRFLLGGATESAITPATYLKPERLNLELLPAGGLFKTGQAPTTPGQRWISAIVVRDDGLTQITQRLQVTGRNP